MIGKTVTLRDITKDNHIAVIRLKVAPEQEKFVSNNAMSLAQAHFEPYTRFWAIYADEEPVGFVQIIDNPEKPEYYIWRFMIGAQHQRQGYGRRALQLVIDYVRTRPNARFVTLSFVPAEGGPEPLYRSMGFVPTGEFEEGEVVAKLEFQGSDTASSTTANDAL
jgi:diamine N-acetyltransferase